MATKIVLPFLGQTMEEGTITKWLKQEGDTVQKGEVIFEVMTDKANMEVESPESGVLRKILAGEGAVVPVKEPVGIIAGADEAIDDLLGGSAPSAEPAVAEAPASAPVETAPTITPVTAPPPGRLFISPRAKKVAAEKGIDITLLSGKGTGPEGRIVEKDVIAFASSIPAPAAAPRITPLAGKMAADAGVDIASLVGSGPAGKIMREDVVRAAAPASARLSGKRGIGRVIPYTGMRKAVGDNVSLSVRTSPTVTYVTDVDMTEAMSLRDQIAAEMHKRYGVKVSPTAMVVKACALAILDHPIVNSSLIEKEIIIHDEINVNVAVSLDNGLVTPVVMDTDRKTLGEVAQDIKNLAAKAREGQLSREEMQGGTFTVSSLNSTVVDSFNPIINPPQAAIVGVCRIVEKPVVVDGEIKVRSMMGLSLVWDHRIMDGAPAADYLGRVKEILEAPYLLLI